MRVSEQLSCSLSLLETVKPLLEMKVSQLLACTSHTWLYPHPFSKPQSRHSLSGAIRAPLPPVLPGLPFLTVSKSTSCTVCNHNTSYIV